MRLPVARCPVSYTGPPESGARLSREDGLERDIEDLQPSREAVEGEATKLVF
jgi:hypothetical protein